MQIEHSCLCAAKLRKIAEQLIKQRKRQKQLVLKNAGSSGNYKKIRKKQNGFAKLRNVKPKKFVKNVKNKKNSNGK